MRTTFQDAVEHLIDYLGGTPSAVAQRDARRCVLEAYRDLVNAFRWSYLIRPGRLITHAPYDGGLVTPKATVGYLQSSGTVPRQLTLSGDVWPAWAADGFIRAGASDPSLTDAGPANYRVDRRLSDTVLTLDPEVNPGGDIAPGAYFKLYQDTYLLPADFGGGDQALYERNFGGMTYVHPREWMYESRYVFAEGTPQAYTITGDPKYPNRLVIRILPFPADVRSIDFLYNRRPRELKLQLEATGRASATAASAVLNGTGTNWTPAMIGAVVRLSDTSQKPPTSTIGDYPAIYEGTIIDVPSATSILADTTVPVTLSGVQVTISDPVEIEDGAMLNAFLRCCEMHMAQGRTLKDKPSARPLYQAALAEAKCADSRSFAGRKVGHDGPLRQRLRDMPINFNTTG